MQNMADSNNLTPLLVPGAVPPGWSWLWQRYDLKLNQTMTVDLKNMIQRPVFDPFEAFAVSMHLKINGADPDPWDILHIEGKRKKTLIAVDGKYRIKYHTTASGET